MNAYLWRVTLNGVANTADAPRKRARAKDGNIVRLKGGMRGAFLRKKALSFIQNWDRLWMRAQSDPCGEQQIGYRRYR